MNDVMPTHFCQASLFFLLVGALSMGHANPVKPTPTDRGNCTPFTWVTDFDGAERAAMVVTAQINGQPVDLQFDTGSDVSGFYGPQLAGRLGLHFDDHHTNSATTTLPLTLNGMELGQQQFHLLPQPPGRVAGRLGLKALIGKIIQIDYPHQRICLLNDQQYRDHRAGLHLTPAKIRSNKLFLYTEVDGDYWSGLFFDTGASLYPLLVDKQAWQILTARSGAESDNFRMQGWSKNKLITTLGATLQGNMRFGGFEVQRPLVHYTLERPRHFADYPIRADGLIGNAPFFDQVVVLDLRKEKAWFGVFKD